MPAAIGLAIAELLFVVGAPLILVNFFVSAIGVALIGLTINIGASLLIGTLVRGQSPTPSPSEAQGQQQLKQALAPRIKSYGRVRVAGPLWWMDTDGLAPATLFLGASVNHGRIGRYVAYHIDENEVELDVNDKVTTLPYSAYDIFIHSRLGVYPETAYSQLETTFGLKNARGDGVATILATIKNPATVDLFAQVFPNGRPLIRVTIESSVVWDPRDANQSRGDPLTWTYSDNTALCLLDYLLSPDGFGMPWERIEPALADWILAADKCDEAITIAGGSSVKRYVCAFSYRLTDDPKDVVARFLSVCDGRLFPRRDGAVSFAVGQFIAPTVTLDDDALVDYSDMTFGQDPLTSVAGIRAQYMSPNHDYREHEAEPYPSAEAVLALSEDRTPQLDLLGVPVEDQARRLMKRAYIRMTAEWTGTITTNLRGLRAIAERYITLQISELGISRSFEVNHFSFDRSSQTCQLSVRSIDESIEDWTPDGRNVFGSFTKIGTSVDPLDEAGGSIGQTAIVFVANIAGIAATPAGWQTPGTAPGAPASINSQVFFRVLDGTEADTTFLSGVGAILVLFRDEWPFPTTAQYATDFTNGPSGFHTFAAEAVPYGLFLLVAGNADFDFPAWVGFMDASKVTIVPEQLIIMRTGAVTMHVLTDFLDVGEVAHGYTISIQDIPPTLVFQGFTIQPGS